MAQYKYIIEMIFTVGDFIAYIKPENIKTFVIDNDYDKYTMPMVLTTLNIDKNLSDRIILDADTGVMNLTVYKFVATEENVNKEIYIREQFTYFLPDDINYNKEIDYMGENKNREDIYRELTIGMMCKKSIDLNKKSINENIVDSTMINIVNLGTKHIPMVIEPFNYNETIKQLTIPPQESVSKFLKFLNNIAVFYDTPYRFFIDYNIGYLVSTSGKAVPKTTDKYNTVMIELHKIDDPHGNILGMDDDPDNKYHKIHMSVVNSYYGVDSSLNKKFGNISAILDTSKSKAEDAANNISKALDKVKGCVSDINKVFNDVLPKIHETPIALSTQDIQNNFNIIKLGDLNSSFNSEVNKMKPKIKAAMEKFLNAPTEPGSTPMTEDEKKKLRESASILLGSVDNKQKSTNVSMGNLDSFKSIYKDISGNVFDGFANISNIPSFVNGISTINIKDNEKSMNSLKEEIDSLGKQAINKYNLQLLPANEKNQDITKYMNQLVSLVQSNSIVAGDDDVSKSLSSIQDIISKSTNHITNLAVNASKLSSMPKDINSVVEKLKPSLGKISEINLDLKGQFANLDRQITQFVSDNKNMFLNIKSNLDNNLKGLNLGSLEGIKNDLSKFADISSIGKLGISKFDINLDINGLEEASDKDKFIRVMNDNANVLKNIKAKIENSAIEFSVNKNDLDSSVFTINKEYIVKNYDAHSDKNGRFLLIRKRELFTREGDKFILNTILDFNKIKENS